MQTLTAVSHYPHTIILFEVIHLHQERWRPYALIFTEKRSTEILIERRFIHLFKAYYY